MVRTFTVLYLKKMSFVCYSELEKALWGYCKVD